MSKSAALLEITPRLQDHDVSKAAIARATNAKVRCKEALTVIRGLELMQACETEQGATKITAQFVASEKHKWVDSTIPDLFWTAVSNAANLAGPNMQAPCTKSVVRKSMTFKQE